MQLLKPRIYFILAFHSYALAQNDLCTLAATGAVPNICNNSNGFVYVSESENGCPISGRKCWCILIDNRLNNYNGAMLIELVQLFNRNAQLPVESQFGEIKLYTVTVVDGVNRFAFQPFTPSGVIPVITSIKIRNNEICRLTSTTGQNLTYHQPNQLSILSSQSIRIPNSDSIVPSVLKMNQQNRITSTRIDEASATETCGVNQIKASPRTTLSSKTNPGEWPWHAAIYKIKSSITNRYYICGGTLINQKTILTIAHCVSEKPNLIINPERLTVELGRHDLRYASVATQEYRIFDVKLHEGFNHDTYENDIAVLILANYVQLTQYINFVCLPNRNFDLRNQIGTTVGWSYDQTNIAATELGVANLPVVDKITCLASNRKFFGKYLTNTNFCAGTQNNTNVCRGFGGGGLVFKVKGQWVLGGILSAVAAGKSIDGCEPNQYVIFTDVPKFIAWIKQIS